MQDGAIITGLVSAAALVLSLLFLARRPGSQPDSPIWQIKLQVRRPRVKSTKLSIAFCTDSSITQSSASISTMAPTYLTCRLKLIPTMSEKEF